MGNTILIKGSNTSSEVPSSLTQGTDSGSDAATEIAINRADGKLFYLNDSDSVTEFTSSVSGNTFGGSSFKIGRDADNLLDFSTDNEITFRVSAGDGIVMKASGEIEATKFDGALEGNADTATVLATSRNFRTNLASTSTAGFTGAAACNPGVTGTLAVGNGGTGVTSMTNLKNALDDETWTFANNVTLAGFVLDGNTITGVDDSGEFTNDDAHIMTSAAVEDKITGYGYVTANDDVSVANLKTRLAGGFGSNAVTIGDSNDVVTIGGSLDVGDGTITTTGSFQGRTIDYSDGDLAMTIADGGAVTFDENTTLVGIVMDGNTITGIDDSGEHTNNDSHIMTSAAVEDKILGYSYITADSSDTLSNKTIAASQVTEISNLTADEGAQLENIGSTTISATQWGYLGAASGAITNTNTNQLTTFTLTGDSGSNQTIAHGNTMDIAGGNAITTAVSATDTLTINHDDTSSQASVNNSGSNFIQDITLDTYGHVTGITSAAASGGSSISFGSDNQIPFQNSGGDDFDYSANFTFDGTDALIGSTGKLQFRDGNSYIFSNAANDLELVATDITLDAATLIDLQQKDIRIGDGTNDVTLTFNAGNDGEIKWSEDENYFQFADEILMSTSEKIHFRDTNIYINSPEADKLQIVSDGILEMQAGNVVVQSFDASQNIQGGHVLPFIVTAGITKLGTSDAERHVSFVTTSGNSGTELLNHYFLCPGATKIHNIFFACDGDISGDSNFFFRLRKAANQSTSLSDTYRITNAALPAEMGGQNYLTFSGMNQAGTMIDLLNPTDEFNGAMGTDAVTVGAHGVQSFNLGDKIFGGMDFNGTDGIRGTFTFVMSYVLD
jgi:hypothetical protein